MLEWQSSIILSLYYYHYYYYDIKLIQFQTLKIHHQKHHNLLFGLKIHPYIIFVFTV